MAIVGVLATPISIGGINASASTTVKQNFGPSNIWAHSALTRVDTSDGDSNTFVSQFVDSNGTHNVSSVGQFANPCTSVTYKLNVTDSFTVALCITEFFA